MQIQKFESPIVVSIDAAHGETLIVDIVGSIEFLLKKWPGKRGDRHREALQVCVDAKAQKTSPSTVPGARLWQQLDRLAFF